MESTKVLEDEFAKYEDWYKAIIFDKNCNIIAKKICDKLKDGELKVYNDENPDGFNPDDETRKSDDDGPKSEITGEVDLVVPKGEIFVSGDNREGSNSYDSRNGLGTIPFCRIVGPAAIRIYPFNKIRFFN